MKRFSIKKANKSEVALLSFEPINNGQKSPMFRAKSSLDPSSKILVPAPPKGLPPPKPKKLDLEFTTSNVNNALPSPVRPAPDLPSPTKEKSLTPVRRAPSAPPNSSPKRYTRSFTEPLSTKAKDQLKNAINKAAREKKMAKYQETIKVEGKLVKPAPAVKPKPFRKLEPSFIAPLKSSPCDPARQPISFIDVGDGLRSSDSESLCSEKFNAECVQGVHNAVHMYNSNNKPEESTNVAEEKNMRKSESSSSQTSEENCEENKLKTSRPSSFPSNKDLTKKQRKNKSQSFRRKRQSPPASPPPPPVSPPFEFAANETLVPPLPKPHHERKVSSDKCNNERKQSKEWDQHVDEVVTPKSSLGPRCLALLKYEGERKDELSYAKGDTILLLQHVNNTWLFGSLKDGENGLVSKEKVKIIEDIPRHVPPQHACGMEKKMIACFDFVARNDKELSLTTGDVITNCKKITDEWLQGEVISKQGLFPLNYVDFLSV